MQIETFYDIAATSGLLTKVLASGTEIFADFRAPDETVLDGLGISREYSIRYPASRLLLAAGDRVEIGGQGYQVREVLRISDGSECRATLSKES